MNRLPAITPREMVKAIKRAGFVEDHQRASDLYLHHPATGQTTAGPMRPGDLKRSLMKKIIKEAGFTEESFRELL